VLRLSALHLDILLGKYKYKTKLSNIFITYFFTNLLTQMTRPQGGGTSELIQK